MIDFVKIKITDEALINQVWSNELLIYQGKSEKRFDDEIKELVTKSYKNLYFTKFQKRLEIKGSLHYFFNDGLHNANDFNIYDCIQTIEQIKELFKLDLNKCKLINLEYGVNVNPIIPVVDLVQNLIYHEKRQFTRPTTHFNYKIAGNEAYKQVKAYDKSVQFPNHCNNTFRFEIKTKQAKFINSLGLFTLQNLAEIKHYDLLINSLLKEWDNVLLFDKSKAVEDKFFNTNFWEEILKNGNRNKFNNQKKLYYKKLGVDNLLINIKKIMQAKINHLKSVQIPTTINLETAHHQLIIR